MVQQVQRVALLSAAGRQGLGLGEYRVSTLPTWQLRSRASSIRSRPLCSNTPGASSGYIVRRSFSMPQLALAPPQLQQLGWVSLPSSQPGTGNGISTYFPTELPLPALAADDAFHTALLGTGVSDSRCSPPCLPVPPTPRCAAPPPRILPCCTAPVPLTPILPVPAASFTRVEDYGEV